MMFPGAEPQWYRCSKPDCFFCKEMQRVNSPVPEVDLILPKPTSYQIKKRKMFERMRAEMTEQMLG
jgi:hypothetical protein